MNRWLATALVAVAVVPTGAAAQGLTLEAALARAERHAYANRIGAAQADAAGAQSTMALRGILPTLRVEAGFVRTTDPIGAFGTVLRQRRIDVSNFDPARLNDPGPVNNYGSALVVEQPLFNADAHLGRIAAARAGDAAEADAQWTRIGTRLDVIRAYYGAVLAAEKAVTLGAAHRAAQQHVMQAEAMERQGLVTRSDALLARVKAGELEAQLVEAQGEAEVARRGLAVLLGGSADSLPEVPAMLPSAEQVRRLLIEDSVQSAASGRADVRAAQSGASAAGMDLQRARSLHLPRVNAFARYDWNSLDGAYRGDENWSVGVMASWTVFGGASEWAERQAAAGRAHAARAGLDAVRAQAELELARAENARRTARLRLDVMERGAQQSAEAHRIVAKRYAGGLATVVELLSAAAVETQSALALSHARYTGIVAESERRRALGDDPAGVAAYLGQVNAGIDQ